MSDQDPELARLRRAFASRAAETAPGADCPPAERLWSAVRGELPPEEVRPLVAHLAECGACAEAWRLAREVDGGDAVAGAAVGAAPPQLSRGWWAAIAASIAAAAVAAVLLQQRPSSKPEYRHPGASGEIRSLLPESRALPRGDLRLRWTPGPEGATYAVQVATERLEPIVEARGLTAAEYVVPPEKLVSVPAGAKLLWRVEAVTPDGARVPSPTFVSRLE